MEGTHAVSAALQRAAERPSNDVSEEDFIPRMVDVRAMREDDQSSDRGDHDWDNYDDFNNYPDAPFPR